MIMLLTSYFQNTYKMWETLLRHSITCLYIYVNECLLPTVTLSNSCRTAKSFHLS